MPLTIKLAYEGTEREKVKFKALSDAFNRRKSLLGYLLGFQSPDMKLTKMSDGQLGIKLTFQNEEEKRNFFSSQRNNLPHGVTFSPDIRLIYKKTEQEKVKYETLMKAFNAKAGMLGSWVGSPRAHIADESAEKIEILLGFDDVEERNAFLQAEQMYLPQGVTLPPSMKLVYENTEQEQAKYRALMSALNKKQGTYNYWLGKPRAMIDETSDTKVRIGLRFDDEEERKEFLQAQRVYLPKGVTLSPNVTLIYQDTAEERVKYQALIRALNKKTGTFGYLFGTSSHAVSEARNGQIAVTLNFGSEKERNQFLHTESSNLPEGINISPNVKLVYRDPQDKEHYQAIMAKLNRQVDTYNYWFGRPRATLDKMSPGKVVVTLNFKNVAERDSFLRKEQNDLPKSMISAPEEGVRTISFSSSGDFQDDIIPAGVSHHQSVQGNVKVLVLSPEGEPQEKVEGVELPPEKKIQSPSPTQQVVDAPKPAPNAPPKPAPKRVTDSKYEDLPPEVKKDIEDARQRLSKPDSDPGSSTPGL